MVKGPSYYNPRRNPKRATTRRNLVLGIVRDEGLITDAEYQADIQLPLGVVGGRGGGVERYPAFVDLVKRKRENDYKDEDRSNQGLRLFTTLDTRVQETPETNVMDQLPLMEKSRQMKYGPVAAA